MSMNVGKVLFTGKKCPVCDSWLIPKHMVEYDASVFNEKDGFCLDANTNFWFCDKCKSRFEAVK